MTHAHSPVTAAARDKAPAAHTAAAPKPATASQRLRAAFSRIGNTNAHALLGDRPAVADSNPSDPTGTDDLAAVLGGRVPPIGHPADPAEHDADRFARWVTPGSVVGGIPAPSGGPLPKPLRSKWEATTHADLTAVRVHHDTAAAAAAKRVGAAAFAVGSHVVFGAGRYQPNTSAGQQLLAHEVGHIVHGTSDLGSGQPLRRSPDGTAVVIVGSPEPLGRYAYLRDALPLEDWEGLNDAARARDSASAKQTVDPDVKLTARDHVTAPLASLIAPKIEPAGSDFRLVVYDALRKGVGSDPAAADAVRGEIVNRWATGESGIETADVTISLVDPTGAVQSSNELLFEVDGVAVKSVDGRLWVSDVDAALCNGSLADIVATVSSEVSAVATAAALADDTDRLTSQVTEITGTSHEDVAANDAESLDQVLTDLGAEVTSFAGAHPELADRMSASTGSLTAAQASYRTWLEAHRKFTAANQPAKSFDEEQSELYSKSLDEQRKAMKRGDSMAAMGAGYSAFSLAWSIGSTDMLTGGMVSNRVALRKAFRAGDVSLRGFREGEAALTRRGTYVGAANAVIMLATFGLGLAFAPASIGGTLAFSGTTAAVGTATVLTTQTLVTNATTIDDPAVQQFWKQGAMSPGDIALASLGSAAFSMALAGGMSWLARGANATLARQLVAESVAQPGLVRALGPGVTARAVAPGVVEVVQEGVPGVLRFTQSGWQMNAPPGSTAEAASGAWTAPSPSVASGTPQTGDLHGLAAFQQPGATPYGVAVGNKGWVVLGTGGKPLTGAWVPQPGTNPFLLPAPVSGPGTTPLALSPPQQLFVDLQGGPMVRPDFSSPTRMAPTFLPTLVNQTPGAMGINIESGDYLPGFAGTTTTNARDLAMMRILSQQLPGWPGPGSTEMPEPWVLDPSLMFPTSGATQVARTVGPPGTTPVPQAFFPPIGGDVAEGVPRLIPIRIGDKTAQQDVTGLQTSTHPQLHGKVDRAYWRRPFALSKADEPTSQAIGNELDRMLKPGGFLELRLLQGADQQIANITKQITNSRVVTVPRGAIDSYAKTGARPPKLTDEQWAILQDAGPDLRGEVGAIGGGKFSRIVRIYKGSAPAQ